ncbi:GSCFA domain-containing protein [uncultured Alistipes sp.]|uniref:GSCFA domain-containing protein n=1 Tax=uncultured Alistipes sp. TaxID=538949 RepID=UPI002729D663|nr:GSCFA domain-containing protein [uncultured Alistipes sp.]
MKFRTEINVAPLGLGLGYADTVLLFGSCFADEMRRRMQELKFRAEGNFTGPLFNPASVAALLRRAQDPAPATLAELRQDADGWWFHYDANTLLSGPDPAAVLGRYNDALDRLRRLLPAARCLVVTFGTAWVYRLKESGRIVANCHKQPQTLFDRTRLSVEEIAAEWSQLLAGPLADKEVVFTVSPVRHLGDGAEGNSLSKATLRVAVGELTERFGHAHYFPACELLADDLRDYRFYADDLVHPSPQAVGYIWEKFAGAALSDEAQALLPEVERLVAQSLHHPRRTDSDAWQELCRRTVGRMEALRRSAGIDFSQEIARLNSGNSR